jgi:hypothetical protein
MLPSHVRSYVDTGRVTLLAATLFLSLAGCSISSRSYGGDILVGQPEVFTRQRLVDRRLTEQQWLEGQLKDKTPTAQSFQGLWDVRTFQGLYNKTDVSFDPLAGKLATVENKLNVQALQNQAATSALQHQIEMLKLRQQLTALQNAGNSTTSTDPAGTAGSGSPGSTSNNPPSAGTTFGPPSSTAPSPSTLFGTPPGGVPGPGEIVQSTAQITAVELLRDQLAWRNAVQAALRDQELDDTHDLKGLTLYTLKFDLSVLPHDNNDGYGRVEFDLAQRTQSVDDDKMITERYNTWVWHLRHAINAEAMALQQRVEHRRLTQEEEVRLAVLIGLAQKEAQEAQTEGGLDSPALGALQRYLMTKQTRQEPSRAPAFPSEGSTFDITEAKKGALQIVRHKYRSALRGLVWFGHDIPIKVADSTYYVPFIGEEKTGPARLKDKLSNVRQYVLVTDPKEQAQNISEVAATETLRNLVLSLQALIPQARVSASNYTEYIHRSQERLQSILRKPVVVAYSDRGAQFGWILGPRFIMSAKGKPQFSHTTVQHSVQVSLAVPGWITSLKLPYRTSWVAGNGSASTTEASPWKYIHVDLPGDDAAITAQLLAAQGTRRTPFIEPMIDDDNKLQVLRLRANQPADILIRGRDLWRNPRVFLGTQLAHPVHVLPDMSGLSAHFDAVAMPPKTPKGDPQVLDLSVVTSEGMATLPRAVEVIAEAAATAPPAPTKAIHGNKSNKVYHLPNCPGYASMRLANLVLFTNEAEAVKAGYRKAGNCP